MSALRRSYFYWLSALRCVRLRVDSAEAVWKLGVIVALVELAPAKRTETHSARRESAVISGFQLEWPGGWSFHTASTQSGRLGRGTSLRRPSGNRSFNGADKTSRRFLNWSALIRQISSASRHRPTTMVVPGCRPESVSDWPFLGRPFVRRVF